MGLNSVAAVACVSIVSPSKSEPTIVDTVSLLVSCVFASRKLSPPCSDSAHGVGLEAGAGQCCCGCTRQLPGQFSYGRF